MAAVATVGMTELPGRTNSRILAPANENFAFAFDNNQLNNPVRRDREESAPHFISYSVYQRTPGRTKNR